MSSSRDENMVRLRRGLSQIVCWPLERRTSEMFGRLAADLRRRGRAMQVIDIMLAATALTLGECIVVSTDSDLAAIPSLKIENWEIR